MAIATFAMASATKRYAAAAQAPVVFLDRIDTRKNEEKQTLTILMRFKNGGAGIARNTRIWAEMRFANDPITEDIEWPAPVILGPGQKQFVPFFLSGDPYRLVMSGAKTLQLRAKWTYESIDEHCYEEETQYEYGVVTNSFRGI